jgi:hypothetical protein
MLKDFFRRSYSPAPAPEAPVTDAAQHTAPAASGAFSAERLAACFVPQILADYQALRG